jgi:hypothetical protein
MQTPRVRNSGPSGRRGWHVLGLVVLAVLSLTVPGRAQSAAEPSTSAVEVMLVGEVGRAPAFSRRVTSWFDPERFRVSVRAVARLDHSQILSPKRDGAVYVWVLLRNASGARLYFATASGSQGGATYLLRDLRLDSGLDEMGAERIAQVLHLSTVALLEGQAASRREEVERMLGQERTEDRGLEAREPSTEHEGEAGERSGQAPNHDTGWGVGFGVGYVASHRSDEGIWHGPRGRLLVELGEGWGLQALVQTALPHTREMDAVALRFCGGWVGLAASYQYAVARGVALEWVAGPGLEVVHYMPVRSLEPDVSTGEGDTEARLNVMGGVGAIFRRSAPRVAVAAECAAALVRTHYDVVVGETRRVLGRSGPVIPSVGLEVRF